MNSRDQGVKTPIETSLIQRIVQGVRYIAGGQAPLSADLNLPATLPALESPAPPTPAGNTVSGVSETNWFGPNQPMRPGAPVEVKGRQWDFPSGYNMGTRPRQYEPVSFEHLRGLADNWDLLRIIIETRKDQLAKLPWSFQPRERVGSRVGGQRDPRAQQLEAFFRRPNRIHSWHAWLRQLVEDLFVIDAPSLYVRKDYTGGVYSLDIMDGATIRPVLDQTGRQPMAPDPAYQQVLKGFPAVNYTADELVYIPRNLRPHKVYGYSPVEQIVMTVNIAIRKQISQLQFFTEGNVPEALIGVPETWGPDQIAQFQLYWDSLLEGDTAARRHAKFVPGDLNFREIRPPVLSDQTDEWLSRVACFAFSIPPTAFQSTGNKSMAQTVQQSALEEGLSPLMVWIKDLIDYLVEKYWGYADLEWVWGDYREQDPASLASINTTYVRAGIKSIDEARLEIGLDPLGMGPAIFTGNGCIFIEDLTDPAKREQMLQAGVIAGLPQQQQPRWGGSPSGAPPAGSQDAEAAGQGAQADREGMADMVGNTARPEAKDEDRRNTVMDLESHRDGAVKKFPMLFKNAEAGADPLLPFSRSATLNKGDDDPYLKIADTVEPTVARSIEDALLFVAETTDEAGEFDTEQFRAKLKLAWDALHTGFEAAHKLTAHTAGLRKDELVVDLDADNPNTQAFLDRYDFGQVRQLEDEQKTAIKRLLESSIGDGMAPQGTALTLKRSRSLRLGLTDWQQGLVDSYEQELRDGNPKALKRELTDLRADKVLQRAIDSGKPMTDTQVETAVKQYRNNWIAHRATTIARTESLRAANQGGFAAAKEMAGDGKIRKTWMATHDGKTRDSHRQLDGQVVEGADTPFTLPDGTAITHPGDPSAPARDVIRCRCTVKYELIPAEQAEVSQAED